MFHLILAHSMESRNVILVLILLIGAFHFGSAQETYTEEQLQARFDSIVAVFYEAPEEAIPLLYEYKELLPSNSGPASVAETVLGLAYQNINLYDSATIHFQESYRIAFELEDYNRAFSAKYNHMNLYVLWLNDALRALEIAEEIQSDLLPKIRDGKKAKFYNALAQIYIVLDAYKEGINAANNGLAFARQEQDSVELQNLFQKLSTIYSYQKKTQEAIQAIDSALLYGLNDCIGTNFSYLSKSYIYLDENNPNQALEQLKEVDTLYCPIHDVQLHNIYLAFANTYKALNKLDSAYKYLNLYQVTKLENLTEESRAQIDALDKLFQVAQNKEALKQLKLKQQITSTERNVVLLILLVLAISSVAGFAYFNLRSKAQRKIAAQKIAQLENEKEVLSLQTMVLTQEEERERIARDLHDSIGALLSTAKLHISNIESEIEALNNLNLIQSTREIIDHASSEVRKVAHNMMPGVLIKLGLIEGIEEFLENVRTAQNVNISFTYDEPENRLPNKYEITIYRLVQELVNNTIKHAQASEIKLMIKIENLNQLVIDYKDDGIGFDAALVEAKTNYGLSSLKSRANFLGGTITMQSAPNKGVHIKVTAPLP